MPLTGKCLRQRSNLISSHLAASRLSPLPALWEIKMKTVYNGPRRERRTVTHSTDNRPNWLIQDAQGKRCWCREAVDEKCENDFFLPPGYYYSKFLTWDNNFVKRREQIHTKKTARYSFLPNFACYINAGRRKIPDETETEMNSVSALQQQY